LRLEVKEFDRLDYLDVNVGRVGLRVVHGVDGHPDV
jgi:hypothetical protein